MISLLVIVGELSNTKTPPPVRALGGTPVPKSLNSPEPPMILNPSRRSALVDPDPKTTVELERLIVLGTQDEVVSGLPSPSIVVRVGPPLETTLTPGNMRIDSL
jgi:hypothetical protein